jgi:CheY-like chemotaxis protein
VLAAANSVEALNLIKQQGNDPVDLLFMDEAMPQTSGKEFSDRVLELYPKTKILFTSAYTENAIVDQGVLNSGAELLQKPFSPSALAQKVRHILDVPSIS